MDQATRHRSLLLALALLAAGVAGCLGTQEDPGDVGNETGGEAGDEDQATTIPWGLENCRTVVAVVPVDADTLADELPEGFEPVSPEEAFGLPDDPRGDGALGFETFECERGTVPGGFVSGLAYGAVFAPVQAPDAAEHPPADLVFYKWDTLVPDEPRRERLQGAGLPAVDGHTDLAGLEAVGDGHVFDVSLTLGNAAFGFSGMANQPAEDFREGFPFVELQQGLDGLATWACLSNEAPDANQGTGTLDLAADHWTSDVVGSESTQAYMVAATSVTFEDASITLP